MKLIDQLSESPIGDSRHMKNVSLSNPELGREQKRVALVTIVLPALGALGAIAIALTRGIHPVNLVVAGVLYLLTTTGLTVGFHRLFTHRAFRPTPAVKGALAILGMMAAQGPLVFWVASHRRHHAYSDTELDCHSPRVHAGGRLGFIEGLWHAHFGWMLRGDITNVPMFAKDLLQDTLLVKLSRWYLLWVAAGLAVPALIGGSMIGSFEGALEGFLVGGLLRVFFVHQITWGLNSLNHVFGRKRYFCEDESRNIAWLALLTMGEGWHNNHHAAPTSAKFGHAWWEIDPGYWVIAALAGTGLCRDVVHPNFKALQRKEIQLEYDD